MKVLNRMTEIIKINSYLLELLKNKIENCILYDKSICICIDNSFISCRNQINIAAEYEIESDYIYFNDENSHYEIHIKLDDTSVITYEEDEECFTIIHNNNEIKLYL